MRLVPADEVDAFPGFVYKLFRISHDHFLAVLDTGTDKSIRETTCFNAS